jgi:DNA-binding helix-hairpin-helix protein with protein kinase domain
MSKSRLAPSQVLQSAKNTYTIRQVLSETGGQGGIYLATNRRGQKRVVKWYWKNNAEQKRNIEKMALDGVPAQLNALSGVKFLWPLDYVSNSESFGYIMEYIDVSKRYNYESVIVHDKKGGAMWDHSTLCEMSSRLLVGFNALHSAGYCYMDVSRDNISFGKPGDIVIFDPDNIRVNDPDTLDPTKNDSPVSGTPGFIAPEILNRVNNPNTKTDLWQLAVFLFLLWVKHHPMDGELVMDDDKYNDINLLCKDPKFIFDPAERDNYVGGDTRDFGYVNTWWNLTPKPMRDLFTRAFTEGKYPTGRVYESAWVSVIDDVKANYLKKCPRCGRFVSNAAPACFCCKAKLPVASGVCLLVFENGKRVKTIPVSDGKAFCGKDLSPMLRDVNHFATVVPNPAKPSLKGLTNETSDPWFCQKRDGAIFTVNSGARMVLKHRNKFAIATKYGKVGICVYDFSDNANS